MSSQHRLVETIEEFKLRIAAIIRAKPEQIHVIRSGRQKRQLKLPGFCFPIADLNLINTVIISASGNSIRPEDYSASNGGMATAIGVA
jgi:hypothetical protein